jgi:hypothetical protein
MASTLWKRLTAALDPTPSDDSYDYDEEARLPQVMPEVHIQVDAPLAPPFNWHEALEGSVARFEDCVHDLLLDIASFRAIEDRLNTGLAHLNARIAREIRAIDMDLCYEPEQRKFFALGEFEKHAPFSIFFSGHVVEVEAPLSAVYAHFRLGDTHEIKTVTLNKAINNTAAYPYRLVDGYVVRHSALTLLLKFAIRHLDGDQLLEPIGESLAFVRWPRNFGLVALMFDLMRYSKVWREPCARVMTRHCNEFYRVPPDLARALQAHLRLQQDSYFGSNFNIALEFEPSYSGSIHAKLTACYF